MRFSGRWISIHLPMLGSQASYLSLIDLRFDLTNDFDSVVLTSACCASVSFINALSHRIRLRIRISSFITQVLPSSRVSSERHLNELGVISENIHFTGHPSVLFPSRTISFPT